MSKQGDAAYAWFLKGYNCSQSVVAAFAPQLGLTEETALRLSAGFGAGIGRMREVCGAFCGVVTVLSMVYADPADPKDCHASIRQRVHREFSQQDLHSGEFVEHTSFLSPNAHAAFLGIIPPNRFFVNHAPIHY